MADTGWRNLCCANTLTTGIQLEIMAPRIRYIRGVVVSGSVGRGDRPERHVQYPEAIRRDNEDTLILRGSRFSEVTDGNHAGR